MKVLFADDSEPIRDRLAARLAQLPNVTVAVAVDTTDALRQFATFKPDVAILDIRMPGGGGIKALSDIKAQNPNTTVIIMTNYPYAQYRRKCLEAGVDFFFDKSTEFEQVTEIIRQLTQSLNVGEVALRTAAAQLVKAKEEQEKSEQHHRDMSILSLLHKTEGKDDAYAMWERTFDSIPDMVAIFDADHRIARVNKMMADKLGFPAVELAGKKCFEYVHGTSCPAEGCPHEKMLHDGKEHQCEMYSESLDAWLDVSVSPVLEDGNLIGAIHVARDITERKQTEESLKTSEVRYRQLFESMHAGFALHEIICDEKGVPCDYRFIEVNPAFEKLTGLQTDNLIGRTVKEVLHGTEPHWIETYGKVALTGNPVQIDDFSEALGRHYSVSVYSPVKGQFATIFTDITEQKNAEEAVRCARDVAEEANRTKTQFLANMSHELRTPLNAIIGFSDLLKYSSLDDEQRDFIQTIGTSGEAMLSLVQDLLDLSKIEMGKMTVHSQPFSVRDVTNHAMAELAALAKEKGLRFDCTVGESIPETTINDADRLRQVLVNLLNNALKFTEKGFVKLIVNRRTLPSESVRIEFLVEDSGEGMSEATLRKIFKPFQQGDNSNTRKHGGSGLGLAISKSLVEQMGGTIWVESREGEGSKFSFDILDQTPPQNPVSAQDVLSQWSGRCVCVWGDDPSGMRAAENLLERCGIMPRYAESLDSITERLTREASADAVLCNLDSWCTNSSVISNYPTGDTPGGTFNLSVEQAG